MQLAWVVRRPMLNKNFNKMLNYINEKKNFLMLKLIQMEVFE